MKAPQKAHIPFLRARDSRPIRGTTNSVEAAVDKVDGTTSGAKKQPHVGGAGRRPNMANVRPVDTRALRAGLQ
jgi:hypothetical protein